MNVPAIVELCQNHLESMQDGFLKDHFGMKLAELESALSHLKSDKMILKLHVSRIESMLDGDCSPLLSHEYTLNKTTQEMMLREHCIFFGCCDIASFLRSQGLEDKCLDF